MPSGVQVNKGKLGYIGIRHEGAAAFAAPPMASSPVGRRPA
jgi:hypothetical protein